MCIRDREYSELLEAAGVDTVKELAARNAENLAAKMKEVNCLLYTSDAADERSSVDLGGRRIIKKKKKLEQWSVVGSTTKQDYTIMESI